MERSLTRSTPTRCEVLTELDAATPRRSHVTQDTIAVGLYVRREVEPGKESDVAAILQSGLAAVDEEPATLVWLALRLGPSTFAVFGAFPDEAGRRAHLAGNVATTLLHLGPGLLSQPPSVEKAEILATKLPGGASRIVAEPW